MATSVIPWEHQSGRYSFPLNPSNSTIQPVVVSMNMTGQPLEDFKVMLQRRIESGSQHRCRRCVDPTFVLQDGTGAYVELPLGACLGQLLSIIGKSKTPFLAMTKNATTSLLCEAEGCNKILEHRMNKSDEALLGRIKCAEHSQPTVPTKVRASSVTDSTQPRTVPGCSGWRKTTETRKLKQGLKQP